MSSDQVNVYKLSGCDEFTWQRAGNQPPQDATLVCIIDSNDLDIGAGLDFTDRLIGYTQGRLDRAQAMLIAAEIAEQVAAARKIGGVTWGNYPGQRAAML